MNRPTILVTGAIGKTGGAVVSQLREQGWPVRAVVRARDARSARLDRLGAETVVADLHDPDQMRNAMQGTTRAYYCPPFDPYMIESASVFAVAARAAKLETIVMLSQWLASPAHPALLTRQHRLVDRLFATIPGMALTVVNPGFFADDYPTVFGMAAQLGTFPSPYGDSRNAPPSNEDIARVAVAALTDPGKHAGKRYRPTGPTLLSADDMAGILGRVLRRKVRKMEMPLWLFLKAARLQGRGAFEMSSFRHYILDHQQGAFAVGAPTADVAEVTDRSPEDFATIARRYAATPEAQRTVGNRMQAIMDLLRTPVSPGYDLDRFDRQQGFPVPPQPQFALQDERWKIEHDPLGGPSEAACSREGAGRSPIRGRDNGATARPA